MGSSRDKSGLVALLCADVVSALGNWVSVIVLPWLVLVSTGSPAKMGLVAAAGQVPYLLSSLLAPPLADRIGLRRTSVAADLGSALAMAAIAAMPGIGYLPLLGLVGFAGALRGVGDRAKHVLLKPMAEAAGVPVIRVTALYETLTRTTQMVGAPLGGLLIFWLGTRPAVLVDAVSFAACAALVGLLVRPPRAVAEPAPERYLVALRAGARFLLADQVLVAMMLCIFLVNVLTQSGTTVFIPLWVAEVLHSPAALGVVLGAFATGGVLGSLTFTVLAPRMPRYLTFAVGITVAGAPRLFALSSHSLALVLVVTFVSGLGISAVNPIFGAMLYERVPAALQTRVFGLAGAVCSAGLPIGATLAGAVVTGLGLSTTVLLGGVLYLAVSLLPLRRIRVDQMAVK
jgi:MFS family permease